MLDFELGSSESAEVSLDLMRRLDKRGFSCERRLFAALDGSAALRNAVKEFFPDSVIQRCLVHKERNIRSKLSKKHWGELARLFKQLRKSTWGPPSPSARPTLKPKNWSRRARKSTPTVVLAGIID